MKNSVRYTLVVICMAALIVCGVLFALHKPNNDEPNNPGVLTPDNSADENQDEDNNQPEEIQPVIYTIRLSFPDNSQGEYAWDISTNFDPTQLIEAWLTAQENDGMYYRLDNLYTDADFNDQYNIENLVDGDSLYACMVEQVKITMYSVRAGEEWSKAEDIKVDKGTNFNAEYYIPTFDIGAQYIGVYSNPERTRHAETIFVANENKELYVKWSTKYEKFVSMTGEGTGYTTCYLLGTTLSSADNFVIPFKNEADEDGGCPIDIIVIEAFSGKKFKHVEIPSGVRKINYRAFYSSYIETVTIWATTPPSLGNQVFKFVDGERNTLTAIYVPAESVEAYKAASSWSAYASLIQPIP